MAEIPKKHVLCITFPHFGHIIPLLELAKETSLYHRVTFVVSASKVADLYKRELYSPNRNANIHIFGLEDGVVADADTSANRTVGGARNIVRDMHPFLGRLLRSIAIRGKHSEMSNGDFSIRDPVDVVIADRFVTSAVLPICHELGVPCLIFNTDSGAALANSLDISDASDMPSTSITSDTDREVAEAKKQVLIDRNASLGLASGIVLNTFAKCSTGVVDTLAAHVKTSHIPVFCVGPIFPPEEEKTKSDTTAVVAAKVAKWLDSRSSRSVVYVSFGTLAALTDEQTTVMGAALLSTGRPFIFSISQSHQAALPQEIRDKVSLQFNDGLDSPFLILPWAPQKAILAHPSTGVFLTHAGWNSVIESVVCGVSMVAWPMFADQHNNGTWIASKGLGVLIPGTKIGDGRHVPADEIVKALAAANKCQAEVEGMASAAEEAVVEGGSSDRDFLKLMKFEFLVK